MSSPKFNSDQLLAHQKLTQFIGEQESHKLFLLDGPRDQKTFLIANTLGPFQNKVIMTAPTNKALSVLRSSNPLQNVNIKLHILMGFQRNIDDRGKIDFDTDNIAV